MTDGQSILKTSLLDLLYELRDRDMPLILGGGYGLYLKQVYLQEGPEVSTLIDQELWPAPRGTEDLDILLKTEVVVDAERMRPVREALNRLGYTAVENARYMQFARFLGRGRKVKIDFLTGPLGPFADDPRLRTDERRIRPRTSVQLHAHRTDEALGFQENLMEITVQGVLSSGQRYESVVYVPPAFTLLLMKLHAFRDRCNDPEKELARHHALDVYRIIAMMTEPDFEQTRQLILEHRGKPAVLEAARIIGEHFASSESLGSLRLKEHTLWKETLDMPKFLSAMVDLFHSVE